MNVDSASDFQVTIEQTESYLNGPVVSQAELDRFNRLLSNELLKVEKVLFQDKCIFFVKAGENDYKSGIGKSVTDNLKILSIIKRYNLFGLLIMVDCFIRREVFNNK